MSQANVELVRRMYAAFDRDDFEAALDYFDPEIVIDASHRVDGRVGHGPEELISILGEWMSTWEGWSHEVETMEDLGDQVLMIETQRGRGRSGGVGWHGRFAMAFHISGSKIDRWTIYDDVSQGRKAVEIST